MKSSNPGAGGRVRTVSVTSDTAEPLIFCAERKRTQYMYLFSIIYTTVNKSSMRQTEEGGAANRDERVLNGF